MIRTSPPQVANMNKREGFTVIELLVVIAVIGVLVGLALPAVQSARNSAMQLSCQNRLKQTGLALHNYHAAHGRFPKSGNSYEPTAISATPDDILSWMVNILPHLEQQPLYDQAVAACRNERRAYLDPPHRGISTPVNAFICPSDDRLVLPMKTASGRIVAMSSYIGIAGSAQVPNIPVGAPAPGGAFDWSYPVRLTDISDGTSNTIHVAERPPPNSAQAGEWYQSALQREIFPGPTGTMSYFQTAFVLGDPCPRSVYGPGRVENSCDRYHFWSLHRGGANFLFCDGAVRFLPYSAREIMSALCTRAWNDSVQYP